MKLPALMLVAAVATLAGCATAPPPAPPPQAPMSGPAQVGPFRLGMPLDEARAAVAGGEFKILSDTQAQPVALRIPRGLSLAGADFEAVVISGRSPAMKFLAETPGLDRRACRERTQAIVGALEPTFGSFDTPQANLPPPKPIYTGVTATRMGTGYVVTGNPPAYEYRPQILPAGSHSRLSEDDTRSELDPDHVWLARRVRPAQDDRIRVEIVSETEAAGDPVLCRTSILVSQAVGGALEVGLSRTPDILVVVETPGIGVVHHSLDGLDLPSDAIEVELTCHVERRTGRPTFCLDLTTALLDGKVSTLVYGLAADRRARKLRFDPALLEQSGESLRVPVTVRLSPADRVAAVRSGPLRPADDVEWRRKPEDQEIGRTINLGAAPPQEFDVLVGCQIQSDGSLVCTEARAVPESVDVAKLQPEKIGSLFHAGPTLKDGSPSAGVWVELDFHVLPGEVEPARQ